MILPMGLEPTLSIDKSERTSTLVVEDESSSDYSLFERESDIDSAKG
jgi:hypothetical protein